MGSLKGKVAIITGAARGQGAHEARLFVAEGARVVMTDLNPAGSTLASELGDAAHFVTHDVGDETSWAQVVTEAITRFGRVDILVNNAGVFVPRSIEQSDIALMDLHYRVNQLGVFLGMKAVTEPMKAVGGGAIVNISSSAGLSGMPNMIAYCSTKWAVRGLTRAAAADLAPYNIRVNSVHPGLIDTPMLEANSAEAMETFRAKIPLKRIGQPDDVAQMVLFLASEKSSFVTGGEFPVSGGINL